MSDKINQPNHYTWHPKTECIEISQWFNGNLAQVIQYVWRVPWYSGNGDFDRAIQDAEKAIRFLAFEVNRLKEVKERVRHNDDNS